MQPNTTKRELYAEKLSTVMQAWRQQTKEWPKKVNHCQIAIKSH